MKEKIITVKDLTFDYRQWSDVADCIETALCLSQRGEEVLSMPCTQDEQTEILQEYFDWINEALNNTYD